MMKDGEYTPLVDAGGSTLETMNILFGDKLEKVRDFYLSPSGEVSDQPITGKEKQLPNPIQMSTISAIDLEHILKYA